MIGFVEHRENPTEENSLGFLHPVFKSDRSPQASDQGAIFFVHVEGYASQLILKVFDKSCFKAFITETKVLY
jgi:hypothetical protein